LRKVGSPEGGIRLGEPPGNQTRYILKINLERRKMGGHQSWKCNNCDNELETGGSYEYYIDDYGNRQFYGHPGASSEDARKHGVYGLTETRYCPTCKQIRNEISATYKSPVIDGGSEGSHWGSEGTYDWNPKCSICNTVLKEEIDDSYICPKCNKGTFKKSHWCIS
jgi:Zn finger protein HypA/HybF involved in hydrogenase expression